MNSQLIIASACPARLGFHLLEGKWNQDSDHLPSQWSLHPERKWGFRWHHIACCIDRNIGQVQNTLPALCIRSARWTEEDCPRVHFQKHWWVDPPTWDSWIARMNILPEGWSLTGIRGKPFSTFNSPVTHSTNYGQTVVNRLVTSVPFATWLNVPWVIPKGWNGGVVWLAGWPNRRV